MSLEEQLDEAIDSGDLNKIKEIRLAIKNTANKTIVNKTVELEATLPKPKRKYNKKKKKVVRVPKGHKQPILAKQPKRFKSDSEYITYMAQLADARQKLLISGGGGPVTNPPIISIDSEHVFTEDMKIDKKLQKTVSRSVRRRELTYENKNCINCNKSVEVASNVIHLYNYDKNNDQSEKPNFYCGQCGI